jgi:hypothetical protein
VRAGRCRGSVGAGAVIALAGAVAYAGLIRRRILTWGATASEAAATLPGDELLVDADGMATRAVGIAAPPWAVWPWLAQMGPVPRGGAYTYDWIENLLGLDMHSVDRVLSEFQHPRPGDTIGFGTNTMRLERVDPERCLAWRSQDGNWVWSFILEADGGSTRLISRNRFCLPSPLARVGMLAMEPASLVMEHRMLRGIKRRAERLQCERASGGEGGRREDGGFSALERERGRGGAEPRTAAPTRERAELDPDAPPATTNEERPSPVHPFKDQGDALENG